jgi:hypothetical protein
MSGRTASNQRRRKPDTGIVKPVTIITVIATEKTMAHKMWYSQRSPKMRISQKKYGFVTEKLCENYCNSSKGMTYHRV